MKSNFKDLVGQKFGKLLVLDRTDSRISSTGKNSYTCFNCLCDCGKIKVVKSNLLLKGKTTSCGCNIGHPLKYGESSFNKLYKQYERNSEK